MSVSLLLGVVYLISELLLTMTRRSRSCTGTKQDRSTLPVVWLVIMVSVAAGIYVAKHWPAAALPDHEGFVFAGGVLFVAGLLLRWWAIIILGRAWPAIHRLHAAHQTAGALHLLNGEKNLFRRAGNKRHRSPTNQQSFRLIGSLRQRSFASW
jgi:protein-S-isoprenylcysteine O-methyltransferase Ste14